MELQAQKYGSLTVLRRHPAIGSEVVGFDIAGELDAERVADLRRAWREHPLLIFPGQRVTDARHIDFGRHFGDLEVHPSAEHRSREHPEIYRISNVGDDGLVIAAETPASRYLGLTWRWHSDSSFRTFPSTGSILHGIRVTEQGGETLFCNLTRVYADLPAALRQRVAGLRVVHSHDHILSLSPGLAEENAANYADLPPVIHPLVRLHPETGAPALFISPHTMERVEGWTVEDSRGLFDELISFATEERFVYRHQWLPDDVIMWDNRCTMHAVTPYDMANEPRIMHRVTIAGSDPVLPA
jgi:alpha-ketoglutarate-dependent taurine dioxygenase